MCTCDSAASSVSQAHSTLARPVLTRYVVRAPSRLSGGQKCKGRGGDGANRRQNRSAHAVREASLTLGRGALYARDQGATKTHLPLRGDAAQDTSAAAAASGSSTMLRSRVEGPHRGVRQLELAGRSRTTPPWLSVRARTGWPGISGLWPGPLAGAVPGRCYSTSAGRRVTIPPKSFGAGRCEAASDQKGIDSAQTAAAAGGGAADVPRTLRRHFQADPYSRMHSRLASCMA
jgi:hypothetical protein